MARKLAEIVPLIGVDEKSAGRRQQNYVTVISNLVTSRVEEVTFGHDSASLEGYYDALSDEQLTGIKAVDTVRNQEHQSLGKG